MKIHAAQFRAAATSPASVPPAVHPEIAVAGRSNVGKSSLLNAMTGRKGLARTSRTPGCTRGLLFFDINDAITLVDLPGYGYASRSHSERLAWKRLIEGFLRSREELAGVLILVDLRRGPEQEEIDLAAYLESVGLAYAFVGTKADKLKRSALAKATSTVARAVAPAIVLPTSSESGFGIENLWRWIRAAIDTAPDEEGGVEAELDGGRVVGNDSGDPEPGE